MHFFVFKFFPYALGDFLSIDFWKRDYWLKERTAFRAGLNGIGPKLPSNSREVVVS